MNFLKIPKKGLGQNFLIDQNIVNKIVGCEQIASDETVLEIGAGYGSLTKKILNTKAKKIFAIEKDRDLSVFLKKKFINEKKIEIINDDVLNIIEENNFGKNIIIFGNLPYNISTKILTSLVLIKKWPPWYKTLIFMFQQEVAERILAKKGSKEYGRLSILCNWRLNIKKLFHVSKGCFLPKPKIDSTVLYFKPKENKKFNIKNPKNLEDITRLLFSTRRKMINKNFLKLFEGNKSIADNLNLNLNQRPEELSHEMFYRIVMKYEELNN